MNLWHRVGYVSLSVVAPLGIWALLVAFVPRLPAMGPFGMLLEALLVPTILVGGFLLLRKATPRHPIVAACIYFPILLALMIYVGVIIEWRLQGDAF